MEKYIFTPAADIMVANQKEQSNLDNFLTKVMTTYGTVELCTELILDDTDNSCACENYEAERIVELETLLGEVEAELASFEQYKPLIDFVQAMNADNLNIIEDLKAEIEQGKVAASVISEIKKLVG